MSWATPAKNMKDERLSGALQENILTLLCFDEEHCKQVRAAVTPHLFESSVFKEVAGIAIDFIDQYGEPVGEHLPDHLEGVLNGEDHRKAKSFKRLLDNLFLAREGLNGKYVVSQLQAFVRQQNIKAAIVKAVECVEEGRVDQAEVELQKGLTSSYVTFERGLSLGDSSSALGFLETPDEALMTGINELDRYGIGPVRGEQYVIMAPYGLGKTWALIQFGKWALLQRDTVLHLTLEMSEKRLAQRYLQSFFAISKRDAQMELPRMNKDRSGFMSEVFYEKVELLTLNDPNIRSKLTRKINREFRRRPPLIIKQFPTGMLTMPMLRAYLDGLERYHKIVPDTIIVDYPRLMQIDSSNLRIELGSVTQELRGLFVERNMRGIIAAQSNREGAESKMVKGTHAGEDFSMMATADTVLTLSQTLFEERFGLARIYVDKARNEEDKNIIMITQAYGIGQFCLDSAPIKGGYDPTKPPEESVRSRWAERER